MTERLEAFAELCRSAEAAASCFDGSKLSRASNELSSYVEWLLQEDLTPEEFEQVRDRLVAYRDLCAFLQGSLHGALLRAAGAETPQPGYGAAVRGAGAATDLGSKQPLQPLLRRYA